MTHTLDIRCGALVGGLVLAALVGLGGCVGDGQVTVTGHAHVDHPRLVYVGPGIWVVEDYHEPVFYSDGYYWRYYHDTWYRSSYYNGGWVDVRASIVPRPVIRVDRPRRYIRYHARANARVKRVPRVHVRDHRDNRANRDRDRGVRVRDHRDNRGRGHDKARGKKRGKGHHERDHR